MYLRVNDTSNIDYARIGQIIFRLKDNENNFITAGVSLSGTFTNELYQTPKFNDLINNNWSVTKIVTTSTPALTSNIWNEILTVPSNANTIQLDSTYVSVFGTNDMHWYYIEGSESLSPYSEPGIPLSQIQIIN